MLTNKIIDGAKARDKQYKIADAQGLYLVVTPRSVKSWRCNYKAEGKHQTHTFGKYPDISLANARLLNVEFKDLLAAGMVKSSPTFDEIKNNWYKQKLPTLKNIKHKQQVIYRLDTFVSPKIGKTPIDAIRRADLVEVVRRVQEGGIIETAHRVATHMRQVFDYAVDVGKLEHHPAAGLSRVLQTSKVKHMPCVPIGDAGNLIRAVNNYDESMARYGLLLLALTFVRTSELRYMRWNEIRDDKFWVIPADRMKLGKPHVVPLSDFALQVLGKLEAITGGYEFVLHSPIKADKPISENFFLDALYRLGYRGRMSGHGFRSLASTVLNEQSQFSQDVIERQLAHKENDAVRAAYNRAEYLDERIKLMRWWSDWINSHLQ